MKIRSTPARTTPFSQRTHRLPLEDSLFTPPIGHIDFDYQYTITMFLLRLSSDSPKSGISQKPVSTLALIGLNTDAVE